MTNTLDFLKQHDTKDDNPIRPDGFGVTRHEYAALKGWKLDKAKRRLDEIAATGLLIKRPMRVGVNLQQTAMIWATPEDWKAIDGKTS